MLKRGDKKLINAWAFYDWANSVYSLVISTAVFPIYYGAVTDSFDTVPFLGTIFNPITLYDYALSFSFFLSENLEGPFMGRSGEKVSTYLFFMTISFDYKTIKQ